MPARAPNVVLRTTERLVYSATNYWLVLVTDAVGALVFLVFSLWWYDGPLAGAAALAAAGFMGWGLLEYTLHRWVLHGRHSMAKRGHARHHGDGAELVSTPVLIILGWAFIVWKLLAVALSDGVASVFVFGLYAGYNWYAVVHHLQHHRAGQLARVACLRRLERRHDVHHRRGVVNYGISTGLWDRVFGTFQPADPISPPHFSSTTRS